MGVRTHPQSVIVYYCVRSSVCKNQWPRELPRVTMVDVRTSPNRFDSIGFRFHSFRFRLDSNSIGIRLLIRSGFSSILSVFGSILPIGFRIDSIGKQIDSRGFRVSNLFYRMLARFYRGFGSILSGFDSNLSDFGLFFYRVLARFYQISARFYQSSARFYHIPAILDSYVDSLNL